MENSSRAVAERVVQSVATYTRTDPAELPLLYDTVDPDALETIVHSMSDGEVCFQYAGLAVTVRGNGLVDVTEKAGSRGRPAKHETTD